MRSSLAAACLFAASGCAEPLSNALFIEDALYVRALPDAAALSPAADLDLEAPTGAGPWALAGARRDYLDRIAPLAAVGDAVRAAPPAIRGADLRRWEDLTVGWTDSQGVRFAWFDVIITRSADGDLTYGVDGRWDEDAAPMSVWSGASPTDGAASIDVPDLRPWLGDTDAPGLQVAWSAPADGGAAALVAEQLGPVGAIATWHVEDLGFAWTGAFQVTEDGATWPGWAVAVADGTGGRARGEVFGPETATFGACWAPDGAQTWLGGDPVVRAEGDPAACTLPEIPL